MKEKLLLILLFVSALSYSQNKIPKGNISDEQILIEYAIYFLEDDILSVKDVKNIIKEEYHGFQIIDSVPSPNSVKGSQIIITPINNVKEQFPPASLEYLEYSSQGLSNKEKKDLQMSEHALLLDFVCEKDFLISTIKESSQLVNELIKDKSAVIYDSETRETFSKEHWSEKRLVTNGSVNISQHITIHFYRKNEYCRAITLGMLKFGLPDICIENLSCKSDIALTSFMNLTAQTILEEQKIDKIGKLELDIDNIQNASLRNTLLSSLYENANKNGTINIIEGTWEEGDPENRLIEISFSENNPQIEHDEIMTELFGSEDKVTMLSHNQELLAASERAKSKIPELRQMFLDGLPVNSHLLIKFPFENSLGEREWMWVEITKWNGDNIKGLLQNEPELVKNLKSGQKVSKNINEMFDYILYKADGTEEGNETSKIILKMQR